MSQPRGRDLVGAWSRVFRRRTRRHRPASRAWLHLESLEQRCLLAPVIAVGDHVLLANLPDQQIQIRVAGGNAVQGVEFFLQVADGGLKAGGQIQGPVIRDADILGPPYRPQNAATIFTGNNTGDAVTGARWPQFWQSGTTTAAGTVSADGLLATVVLDTSGLAASDANNPFELKLKGTLMGDSNFIDDQPPDITNGWLILKEKPVARIAAPSAVPAGGTAVLDGGASQPWDTNDTILAHEWDLDGDDAWGETGAEAARGDETGAMPTFSAAGLSGPSTWTVRLRVKDNNFAQNPAFVSEVATAELVIASVPPWQNARHPCDVSDDGFITPEDVVIQINSINTDDSRALAVPPQAPLLPPPYFDSSGDNWLTPLDVLVVINYLNLYGPGPVPSAQVASDAPAQKTLVGAEGEAALRLGSSLSPSGKPAADGTAGARPPVGFAVASVSDGRSGPSSWEWVAQAGPQRLGQVSVHTGSGWASAIELEGLARTSLEAMLEDFAAAVDRHWRNSP